MAATSCAACGIELPADARFCPRCGRAAEAEAHDQRRLATVLFADIVGSTELAVAHDPEDLRRQLMSFFDVCREVISEFGGRVEKFIGDAVMAVFGVPRAFGDDVDRAVGAALRLVERVDLPIRVGVNTGEVLAVETGPDGPVSVTGDAVHAAARLQAAAAPGQVLLGERTARAVRLHGTRPLGPLAMKGFAEPLPVWEALGFHETLARRAPFVGRHDELRLLELLHRRSARAHAAHLALVVGEPGSGKSRLAAELLERVATHVEGGRIALLSSSPVQAAGTIGTLGQLARALCDAPDLARGQLHAAVVQQLERVGASPNADDAAHWIAVSTGDADASNATGVVDEQVGAAWSRLLRASVAERPLTIVMDDVQWAEQAVLRTLARALAACADESLFVILLSRPTEEQDASGLLAAATHLVRLELLPLTAEDAAELARYLLPSSAEQLRAQAVSRAAGNPFFIHELALVLDNNVGSEETVELPDTVQSNVVARLDALPQQARHLLQVAAVLGSTFDLATVAAVGGEPSADVVGTLVRRDFLTEQDQAAGTYSFRHAIIREVAYAQLTRTARAQLHERAAERTPAPGVGAAVAVAADHMLEAARLSPTAARTSAAHRLLLQAADDARRRGHGHRAWQLMEQAAEVAPTPGDAVEALKSAAWLAWGRWRGDDAIRLFLRLADVARDAAADAVECEAMLSAAEIATRFAGTVRRETSVTELSAWYGRARERLPVDDARLAAFAQCIRCWINVRTGQLDDAQVDDALALASASGDARIESFAFDTATAHNWSRERMTRAAELASRRRLVVTRLSDPLEIAIEQSDALVMAADTALMTGNLPEFEIAAAALHDFEVPRGNGVIALTRPLLLRFFRAEWDELLLGVPELHEAWVDAGRPNAGYATPAAWAAAAACRVRGDITGEQQWAAFADQMSPAGGLSAVWGPVLLADADVHRGRARDALARLNAMPEIRNQEMRPFFIAVQAEATVVAGGDDAAGLLDSAAVVTAENAFARAVVRRAAGLLRGDEGELRTSYEQFVSIGAAYQAARTGVLLNGAERTEAEEVFARLRVPVSSHDETGHVLA